MIRKYIFAIGLLLLTLSTSLAQVSINDWETHTSGMKVISVDVMHERIYAATPYEVYYYNTNDNSINKLSKINGLSDFGVSVLRHNNYNDKIFIGYTNTNIDIIDNKGRITNISDIKNKNILGNKTINDVYFIDDLAYVCCGFGIVVVDMTKMEIRDTYIIGNDNTYVNVNDITLYDNKLYAATSRGVIFADYDNPNLADHSQWQLDRSMIHDLVNYSEIETFNGRLIANYSENKYNTDTMFVHDGTSWDYFLKDDNSIKREIKAYDDRLILSKHYSVMVYDKNINLLSNFANSLEPFATTYDVNRNCYWIGDKVKSLIRMNLDGSNDRIVFNGPFNNSALRSKPKAIRFG